ncbi:MAG TPA: Re/Si-specific NAD(P)(+) transhydrogenase subunit alpha [Thermomicrobiales bacterium]|nr:Re/Si-specific NAD(P)(+) transhydrogenase subunit alpha [Thermomicrobiales bacterium]
MTEGVLREPGSSEGNRLTIGVPREAVPGETRVGLIPDTVGRLVASNVDVLVQSGAGEGSSISDDEYVTAGATVVPDAGSVYERADLIVKVQAPVREGVAGDELASLRPGQLLVSFLAPLVNHDLVRALADQGVTALAVDAVPRITRAQSMDALSAMSTIAGYKAVLLAADHLPKFFPLLMTAAGTIAPAKVLVIGAGVAGLQAIATARRLGAVVEAYDARPVVKEQVESLGARFVEIDTGSRDAEAAGGYARAATEVELRLQQEGLNTHVAKSDVVITTALVPGRPAPRLVPASAVISMRTGSVIVDLAGEAGGNCELSVPGETVVREGVTILAPLNMPSTMPVHASQMYSRVIQNFLGLLIKDGEVNLDLNDAIIKGMCITHGGDVIQEQTRQLMNLGTIEAPVPRNPAQPEPHVEQDSAPAEDTDESESEAESVVMGEAAVEGGDTREGRPV